MDEMDERARQRLMDIRREWEVVGPHIGDIAEVSCPDCGDLMRYINATQARCVTCGRVLAPPRLLPPLGERAEDFLSSDEVMTQLLREHWQQVIQQCKTRKPSIAALLLSARPVAMLETEQHGYEVLCEVEFTYHLRRLQASSTQAIVEWAIQSIVGVPCQVHFLGERERGHISKPPDRSQ